MRTDTARTSEFLLLFLLVTTISLQAEGPPAADDKIGPRVAEMFQVGFVRSPNSLRDTQRIYESTLSEATNKARIEYAHGLILWRQLRTKEAQAEFLSATKREGKPYWPAWQALIWTHFVSSSKEYDTGYDRLLRFAKVLQKTEELSEDEQQDETYWIGRVMGALEMVIDSPQQRETWMQTEKKLTDIIGPVLIDAYNRGKEDVHARHALLEEDIQLARDKMKKQQSEKTEKALDRREKSIEAAKEKSENLKKSAAEMKDAFEEQTSAYKKDLQRMEREYAFHQRRSMSLMASMATIDQAIFNAQQRNRNQNNSNTQNLNQSIEQAQNQRLIFEMESQREAALAQQVSMSAQKLTEARAEYLDQYQKTTGEIVKEDAEVAKWKDRAVKEVSELKKAESKGDAKAAAPVPVAKIQLAKSFRTYIDFDVFVERDKVLDSFGIKAIAK